MKKFLIVVCAVIWQPVLSQKNEAIVVNPVKQNQDEVLKRMYQYPQFLPGKAIYLNGDVTPSKLNYNYILNQVIFISPAGDTLQLLNGANFSKIVIDVDTFYYYNKVFLQQVTHDSLYNVLKKRSLVNMGSEKKGAYGTYSGNSAITTVSSMNQGELANIQLPSDENFTFAFKETYYLSGKFGAIYAANKKGANDLFGKKQKELKQFLDNNPIDFNKTEDLQKLMAYARTVLK
jgi:hypothetical protein